jgi:hypothetical protein
MSLWLAAREGVQAAGAGTREKSVVLAAVVGFTLMQMRMMQQLPGLPMQLKGQRSRRGSVVQSKWQQQDKLMHSREPSAISATSSSSRRTPEGPMRLDAKALLNLLLAHLQALAPLQLGRALVQSGMVG